MKEIYYLSDNFTILDYDKCKQNDKNVIYSDKKVESIGRILKKYKGIQYGLGSSCIKYDNEYIGVAHIKVSYGMNMIPQFHSFFTKYIKAKLLYEDSNNLGKRCIKSKVMAPFDPYTYRKHIK